MECHEVKTVLYKMLVNMIEFFIESSQKFLLIFQLA